MKTQHSTLEQGPSGSYLRTPMDCQSRIVAVDKQGAIATSQSGTKRPIGTKKTPGIR